VTVIIYSCLVRPIAVLFFPLIFLFIEESLSADSITIATGETITATFGLSNYEFECGLAPSCPSLPEYVRPGLYVALPSNPADQYSVQAYFESTTDGQIFPIGTIPLEIALSGSTPVFGIFAYGGGIGGSAFPNDATFWGTNPSADTFELVFQNTGDPFTLLYDPSLGTTGFLTPEDDISTGVYSIVDGNIVGSSQNPASVTFAPEPRGLGAIVGLLLAGLVFAKKQSLNS
jgi:hypothetical protein